MPFQSVLAEGEGAQPAGERRSPPAYFRDLNLDRVVAALTAGLEEYDLTPFFYETLRTADAIAYRHEVMRDLEQPPVRASVAAFAAGMRLVREDLAQAEKLRDERHADRWRLRAVETYCAAVRGLRGDLAGCPLGSRALLALREYLESYANGKAFTDLASASGALARELGEIRYCLAVKDNVIRVRAFDGERDYAAEVLETFERFRQGDVEPREFTFAQRPEMNHVEAKILEFVAALDPAVFARLSAFARAHRAFSDPCLVRFDREIHFYVAYLSLCERLRAQGLAFCYPAVSAEKGAIESRGGFDLALALASEGSGKPIVANDVQLRGQERIIVVTGPNQGGKTTFARAFGQLHHLASIGCPVPGTSATLLLFDDIYTHFERGENLADRRGKLQDDVVRVREILERMTPRSVVIVNEIFASTTLTDASMLSKRVLETMQERDVTCVCVTFLDELASLGPKVVSMVSTVLPEDPSIRTFRIVRASADGRSYALSLAEKYRLTYDLVKARIPS